MPVGDALARVYAVLLTEAEVPESHRDEQRIELTPGVRVFTAFDAPDTLRLLTARGVEALGDRHEVFRRAVENLTSITVGEHHAVSAPGGAVFHRVTGASPFTASTVLVLDRTVAAVTGRPLLGDGALVGLPTRHELVFHPLEDTSAGAALEAMARHTAARHTRGPEALDPVVHWWRAGRLVPLARVTDGSAALVPDAEFDALLRRLPPARTS